jgi:hypothetical protein
MTDTFGLKVSKTGASVGSTDVRDLIFHHNYTMLKYHSNTSTSVTLTEDQTEASTTVSHNLGYVPAFLVYYKRSDESVERLIPDIPYGVDFDYYPWAYATTTGVTVGYSYKTYFNRATYTATDYYNTYWGDNSAYLIGRTGAPPTIDGSTGRNGAVRFTNVAIAGADTITRAKVYLYAGNKNGSSSLVVRWHNYGIDEDNTASFGDPFGRDTTTATSYQERTVPGLGDYVEVDVLDEATEIKNRVGWSSGNAMGFTFIEDGGDDSASFWDTTPPYSYMELTKDGSLTVYFRVIIFKDKIA